MGKMLDKVRDELGIHDKMTEQEVLDLLANRVEDVMRLPAALMTEKVCDFVVSTGYTIGYQKFPRKYWTAEKSREIVEKDGYIIFSFIPTTAQTEELLGIVGEQQVISYCFERLADRLKTVERCKLAVDRNANNIRWVPKAKRTQELLVQVFSESSVWDIGSNKLLKEIDASQLDSRTVDRIIRYNPIAAEVFGMATKLDLYDIARDTESFRKYPKEKQTKEFVGIAVKVCGSNIHCVREDLIDFDLVKLAASSNGFNAITKLENPTDEQVLEIVKIEPHNFMFVKKNQQTEEMVKLALDLSPEAMNYVAARLKPFAEEYLKSNGASVEQMSLF